MASIFTPRLTVPPPSTTTTDRTHLPASSTLVPDTLRGRKRQRSTSSSKPNPLYPPYIPNQTSSNQPNPGLNQVQAGLTQTTTNQASPGLTPTVGLDTAGSRHHTHEHPTLSPSRSTSGFRGRRRNRSISPFYFTSTTNTASSSRNPSQTGSRGRRGITSVSRSCSPRVRYFITTPNTSGSSTNGAVGGAQRWHNPRHRSQSPSRSPLGETKRRRNRTRSRSRSRGRGLGTGMARQTGQPGHARTIPNVVSMVRGGGEVQRPYLTTTLSNLRMEVRCDSSPGIGSDDTAEEGSRDDDAGGRHGGQ